MEKEELLTVQMAAKYLKIANTTLMNKARAGEVPCYKPAGQFYFYKSELDAWIRGETETEKRKTDK